MDELTGSVGAWDKMKYRSFEKVGQRLILNGVYKLLTMQGRYKVGRLDFLDGQVCKRKTRTRAVLYNDFIPLDNIKFLSS